VRVEIEQGHSTTAIVDRVRSLHQKFHF
jgi:hypothetical protein